MNDAQLTTIMIKAVISSLPPEDQVEVNACAAKLHRAIDDYNKFNNHLGYLALALVGAEVQEEVEAEEG